MQNRAEINFNHYRHLDQSGEELPEDTKDFLEREHAYYERLRGVLENDRAFGRSIDAKTFALAKAIIARETGEFDPAGVQALCMILTQEFEKSKKLSDKIAKMKWVAGLLKKEVNEL